MKNSELFFSTPQNNFNLRDDLGLSDNDQRHRLVISGSIEAPKEANASGLKRALHDFQLSYIFTYASRLPFNVLLGSDRNFDTNNNDRPVGVGRNTGRGFDFASLDLRLRRRFRITERVSLEANNAWRLTFVRAVRRPWPQVPMAAYTSVGVRCCRAIFGT